MYRAVIASVAVLLATTLSFADDPTVRSAAPRPDDSLAEARALIDRERWHDAAETFGAFFEKNPDSPLASEARYWTGYCRIELEEYESAIDVLRPFLTNLADDKWADDALRKLGIAHLELGEEDEALTVWKRQLEKYPGSLGRADVYLDIIDVLFYDSADQPECLAYCERLTREFPDRHTTTEARYLGAYCLNALRRFDDSEDWADEHFDPASALEEGWRRLLGAQRDLLRGHADSALTAVDALTHDFPDLDHDARQDLLVRTCYVLRSNGHADRARQLVLAELHASSGRTEDEIGTLFDALSDAFGKDRRGEYFNALKTLGNSLDDPMLVRVLARDRRADALREVDLDIAESSLRDAIHDEPTEYGRVRAARQLAEILADERDDPRAAARVLHDLRPSLKRHDLIHQIESAIDELEERRAE